MAADGTTPGNWVFRNRSGRILLDLNPRVFLSATALIALFVLTGLLLYVLLTGPTLFVLNGFVANLGLYRNDFFYLGFWNETYTREHWQNGWTVFYRGWWIAWSPSVGTFIARISCGHTVSREFVGFVPLVSTLPTFV